MKKILALLIVTFALSGCTQLLLKPDRKIAQQYYLPATIQEIELSEPYAAKQIPVMECVNDDCRQIGTTYTYETVVTYRVITQYYNQNLTYQATENVMDLSPARVGQKVIIKLVYYEDGEIAVTAMELLP